MAHALHAGPGPRERLRDALQHVELAGAYQRAARARREGTAQVERALLM